MLRTATGMEIPVQRPNPAKQQQSVFQAADIRSIRSPQTVKRGANMERKSFLAAIIALLVVTGCNMQGPNHGQLNAAAVPSGGSWQKYQDPLEQAFTLDVPSGWTVKGGMFRMGYSDHRVMVDLTSPDGKTNIRFGDVSIPTYFLPNQNHREGEVYDLGLQAQGTVARYHTGEEFAKSYGRVRFLRPCKSLTPQANLQPALTHLDAPQGAQKTTEGEATFTCLGAEGERVAFVYAQTALFNGLWQVTSLASYLAPQGQVTQAREIALHSSKSFQLSPAWIQKQNQLDQQALVYQRQRQAQRRQAIYAQQAQFEAQMQAMRNQVASFERGQAQRQSQFEAMDSVISGITPATDPYGNNVSVFNGPHSHYWINPGTGQQVNSDQSPGPGWQPLTLKY